MAEVALIAEPYPREGVLGIEVEELTHWDGAGWVQVLATSVVGTFPDYVTVYPVTITSTRQKLRYRWEKEPGKFTEWASPVSLANTPTNEQVSRFTDALIQKATRFYVLHNHPLGHSGMTEWGAAMTRPDYEIEEMLYGLRFRDWEIDLSSLVTPDDVIRVGLQTNPSDWAGDPADIQRAIDSAVSWVAERVLLGLGIA